MRSVGGLSRPGDSDVQAVFMGRPRPVGTSLATTYAGGQTIFFSPCHDAAGQATADQAETFILHPGAGSVLLEEFVARVASNGLSGQSTFDLLVSNETIVAARITVPAGGNLVFDADILVSAIAGTGNNMVIRATLGGTGAQSIIIHGFQTTLRFER